MIKAEHLTKDYGLNRAVDDVSFQIGKGEIVGLLGPNGSGKSTIMRMLTGFFTPTEGTCSIAGRDIRTDSLAARTHVGYLPERVALYPDMSVRGYLSFVARVREVDGRVASYVDDALQRCGLTDVHRKRIGKLSRGYRQRVGIAQAIVHRPDVLILDEPTVGLDPRQIVEIRSLIRHLAGGVTILLSTHILPEVSLLCRRVLILDRGKLIAEDTAEGLAAKTAGRGEVTLELEAPEDVAVLAILACKGVRGAEVDGRVDGRLRITVRTDPATDAKPELVRAAVEKGWPVHEVSPKLLTLEDLFVEILADSGSELPSAEERG